MAAWPTPTAGLTYAQSLSSGRSAGLSIPAQLAYYTSSGHIVYGSGGSLFAARFDPERLELIGSPRPLIEDIAARSSGTVHYGLAGNGTLAYLPGVENPALVLVDSAGASRPFAGGGKQVLRAAVLAGRDPHRRSREQ